MTSKHVDDYEKARPKYEALCREVGGIIEKSFKKSKTKTHSIETRAKTIKSFRRKVNKFNSDGSTKYSDPLNEITDLAGVRIIAYTIDDIRGITIFLDENFEVLEKRDVGEERVEKGQFGYQSIHYLVKLTKERLALPDFSDHQDLICEIQVRTVLQHAWAEMEHDIQYQGSENIPKSVKRKFLSLAGLLEIADREFASIQREDRSLKKGILSNLQRDLTRDEIEKSSESQSQGRGGKSSEKKNKSGAQVRELLAAGKIDEAVELYNEKIKREPSSYTLFVGRARAFFLLGETDRALQDLEKAQELQPENEAVANLRKSIKDGSPPPSAETTKQHEANAKSREGDLAITEGHPEKAYLAYLEAQTLGASWPFTTLKLALASIMASDPPGARIHLDELRIHRGTPMEINITALRTILAALEESDELPHLLEKLKVLKDEMGDFNLTLSPLSLLRKVDGQHFWNSHVDAVTEILDSLE